MRETDGMKSSHYIHGLQVTQSAPIMLLAIMAIFIMSIQILVPRSILQDLGFTLQKDQIKVDDDLPNYFTALKLQHADELTIEYNYLKKNFGFEIQDPGTI